MFYKQHFLTVAAPPRNPQVAEVSQSSITVVWDAAVSEVSGYEVSISESNGPPSVVASRGVNVLSVTIEQLNPTTDYIVYIRTLAGLGIDQTRSRPASISQTTGSVMPWSQSLK